MFHYVALASIDAMIDIYCTIIKHLSVFILIRGDWSGKKRVRKRGIRVDSSELHTKEHFPSTFKLLIAPSINNKPIRLYWKTINNKPSSIMEVFFLDEIGRYFGISI